MPRCAPRCWDGRGGRSSGGTGGGRRGGRLAWRRRRQLKRGQPLGGRWSLDAPEHSPTLAGGAPPNDDVAVAVAPTAAAAAAAATAAAAAAATTCATGRAAASTVGRAAASSVGRAISSAPPPLPRAGLPPPLTNRLPGRSHLCPPEEERRAEAVHRRETGERTCAE